MIVSKSKKLINCLIFNRVFISTELFTLKVICLRLKKAEVLFEELSHHKLTYGNILNQSSFNNRKFENYAVRHSYETAIPLDLIINAYKQGISNLFELAEFVQLSEEYVVKVLKHYKSKNGQSVYHDNHLIVLDPLQVFEYKDVGE